MICKGVYPRNQKQQRFVMTVRLLFVMECDVNISAKKLLAFMQYLIRTVWKEYQFACYDSTTIISTNSFLFIN